VVEEADPSTPMAHEGEIQRGEEGGRNLPRRPPRFGRFDRLLAGRGDKRRLIRFTRNRLDAGRGAFVSVIRLRCRRFGQGLHAGSGVGDFSTTDSGFRPSCLCDILPTVPCLGRGSLSRALLGPLGGRPRTRPRNAIASGSVTFSESLPCGRRVRGAVGAVPPKRLAAPDHHPCVGRLAPPARVASRAAATSFRRRSTDREVLRAVEREPLASGLEAPAVVYAFVYRPNCLLRRACSLASSAATTPTLPRGKAGSMRASSRVTVSCMVLNSAARPRLLGFLSAVGSSRLELSVRTEAAVEHETCSRSGVFRQHERCGRSACTPATSSSATS